MIPLFRKKQQGGGENFLALPQLLSFPPGQALVFHQMAFLKNAIIKYERCVIILPNVLCQGISPLLMARV